MGVISSETSGVSKLSDPHHRALSTISITVECRTYRYRLVDQLSGNFKELAQTLRFQKAPSGIWASSNAPS